jgi:hypothetical protein
MAKHKTVTSAEHLAQTEGVSASAPADDGYEPVSDGYEIAGFWAAERGPLHGLLMGGYEYVQKRGKGQGKVTKVYVFKLLEPAEAVYYTYDGSGRRKELTDGTLDAGQLIGVFGSVGLRALDRLRGARVKLARLGKQTLRSGNAMWQYDIRAKGGGQPIEFRPPVEGDSEPF